MVFTHSHHDQQQQQATGVKPTEMLQEPTVSDNKETKSVTNYQTEEHLGSVKTENTA